ncbi:MAG: 2-oxo acid dehydrogenase subunit E2 [Chloroflexota bacterium]|nr:MAG: 2-oxo acid dehydrogenase subunit E2 [Chloroflexota bacterium]
MATQVTLPRLSPGMNEAAIARWLRKSGDTVKRGEPLFEVETEKVATEVPSPDDGVLTIVVPEGMVIAIGVVIAHIGAAGEIVAVTGAPRVAPTSGASVAAATPVNVAASQAAGPASTEPDADRDSGRVFASPAARRLARELNVDVSTLHGSGPGGRVIEKDVHIAAARPTVVPATTQVAARSRSTPTAAAPAALTSGDRAIPMSSIRRVIAERMHQSQIANATVTVTVEVDMGEATTLRQQLIGEWEAREGVRVTFTDIIARAVAKALTEHPRLNASLVGDRIVQHGAVHLGIAVALDEGLIVPVVRDAHTKTILEIGSESKSLSERARANKLAVSEITGGTFTLTNLGTTGVDTFTPIINPPECAILGVGKIAPRPVARGDQVVVRPTMWLSLTFDHRIVDGHPAALFLRRVQEILEKPYLLFV